MQNLQFRQATTYTSTHFFLYVIIIGLLLEIRTYMYVAITMDKNFLFPRTCLLIINTNELIAVRQLHHFTRKFDSKIIEEFKEQIPNTIFIVGILKGKTYQNCSCFRGLNFRLCTYIRMTSMKKEQLLCGVMEGWKREGEEKGKV